MRPSRGYRFLWVVVSVQVIFFLCFALRPLWAQAPTSKRSAHTDDETLYHLPQQPPLLLGDRKGPLDRISLIASLDAAFSWSHVESEDESDSGGNISAILAPQYRFNDSSSFTLMYNGSYYKELNFYSDLVGPRATTATQRHNITPMFRINFGEDSRYFLVPSLFYTRTYNKDVEGGGWNDGLYNYRDFGGGFDFGVRDLGFVSPENGTLRLGLQYYSRHYPNYDSLLDTAVGNDTEKDERDYDGLLTKIGYMWRQKSGLSWGANYYLLYKMLDDKKVVDYPSGVLSSDEQRDYWHNLTLDTWYDILDILGVGGRLRVGVGLNGDLYDSNQNYYDGMGTIDPSDDVPIENFYDFYSYRVRPNIQYTFATFPLTAGLSYSYQKTDYADRPAQNSEGNYKDEKQWERKHITRFSLRYALYENLSLYSEYRYLDVTSNNDNTTVYLYDHKVHYLYAGVSFRL